TYGTIYRDRMEPCFTAMTAALVPTEHVNIIAYNNTEKNRIISVLNANAVPLANITFYIIQTNDCWARDNGPMYVYTNAGQLKILDWGFDGWGNDAPYTKDNAVPKKISDQTAVPRINLSAMELEGGAVCVDGAGTFLATRSSIQGDGRNPALTETDINNYLIQYLGVSNIVWLDGLYGGGLDITDTHIDGFATFLDSTTLVTLSNSDLSYWGITSADRTILNNMTNANGNVYTKVILPLTNKNVKTTWGANVGFKGSYNNYYVCNSVVLVPTYSDVNDATALSIIQSLYPSKTVVGIDCRNAYFYGGMVHCLTQQQPVNPTPRMEYCASTENNAHLTIYPNPASDNIIVQINSNDGQTVRISILDMNGKTMLEMPAYALLEGNNQIDLQVSWLPAGLYMVRISGDVETQRNGVFQVVH
ncbi:MAG TPA: agmatine deiminase family protein, partial [Chitinophagales bacterium]|nr:agmatine deiminase family protein [Chitinophagales bacterium]